MYAHVMLLMYACMTIASLALARWKARTVAHVRRQWLYQGLNNVRRGLGKLAMTVQQAKAKQLRRVKLLKSQTHQKASLAAHQQGKACLEEYRACLAGVRQREWAAERAAHDMKIEVHIYNSQI